MSAPRSGLVAVLFTDLVGSTELMSQLGDRAFDDLRRRHFAALGRAVAAHGGEEVKNTGDGLMAVFPSAAEAVEAAVAMQQATARQAKGTLLAIRVGIAVGDATFEGGDYFGTPVVEAARLVATARPGQILATAVVRMLAGSRCTATFTDQGPLVLKGLPEPVAVCEVVWQPTGSTIPVPALLTDVGRVFVGRDAELERLNQLWKETAAGERRVALLAGEPGVGKTRLAAELAGQVHDRGAVVLAGRCDEDLGVPYQPFVEALRHFVDHAPPEDLEERLGRYGGELVRLLPELTERAPDLAVPLRSDPETERYRLFDAVTGWLGAASAEDPVLLVLDDLQWAAKPTLLLLRHLLRSGDSMRLLVAGTYRDTDIGRGHPLTELLADVRRVDGVERFPLMGLDALGVAAFVEQAAGHDLDEEGEGLARAVWVETEGNPFFVAEVLRHLSESGAVQRRDGRWVVTAGVDELGIPEGVRDVVGRRLSRLSAVANRVLACASVVGLEFEPAVVQTAGGFSEDVVLSALEEAVATRLVVETAGGSSRFAHALVRATLYDELTVGRRTALHRKVAEAIETVHGSSLDDQLPALAHHWARASAPTADTAKAVDYATRAGMRAVAQLAHDEALRYYRQALDLLEAAGGEDRNSQRCELLLSLGEAQRRAGDPGYRQTLLDAAALATDRGDNEVLVRAALANTREVISGVAWKIDDERVVVLEAALAAVGAGKTALRARLLAALGLELSWLDDRTRRIQLSDEALSIARSLNDPGTLTTVLLTRHATIAAPENLSERLALTDELIAVANQLDDPVIMSRALSVRVRAAMEAGDIAEVDRCLRLNQSIVQEAGQPALAWWIGLHQTGRVLLGTHLDEADRLATATLELGQRLGHPDARIYFLGAQFQLRFEQNRLPELETEVAKLTAAGAVPAIEAMLSQLYYEAGRDIEARTIFEDLAGRDFPFAADILWLLGMSSSAAVCAAFEDPERAGVLYPRLLPYSRHLVTSAGGTIVNGSGAHHLGVLATVLARFDDAEGHFADAESIHQGLGAPAWLARTRLEWARMLLRRKQPRDAERAAELLGQALATARDRGLANVERRAVELLQ